MAGRRHLTFVEAVASLRRGGPVEQFLGRYLTDDGRNAARWLTARKFESLYHLGLHEVQDIGTADFLDVYEFTPLDDEEYIGEGRVVAAAGDPAVVLLAGHAHGAEPDRWVNFGVVQDEYRDRQA